MLLFLLFSMSGFANYDLPMPVAKAKQHGRAPKSNERPHMISEISSMDCLPEVEAKAVDPLLDRLSLYVNDEAKPEEKLLLARVAKALSSSLSKNKAGDSWIEDSVMRIEDVLPVRTDGGCLPGKQDMVKTRPAIFFARSCPEESRQGAQKIPLDGATIVHEYGHLVANRALFYPDYDAEVSDRCEVSTYCVRSSAGVKHSSRNEEFAEVFAAFVFVPARLKSLCPTAYQFMRQRVFTGALPLCAQEKKAQK